MGTLASLCFPVWLCLLCCPQKEMETDETIGVASGPGALLLIIGAVLGGFNPNGWYVLAMGIIWIAATILGKVFASKLRSMFSGPTVQPTPTLSTAPDAVVGS